MRLPDPEAEATTPGRDERETPTRGPVKTTDLHQFEPGRPTRLVGGNVAPFVPREPRNPLFMQSSGIGAVIEPLGPRRSSKAQRIGRGTPGGPHGHARRLDPEDRPVSLGQSRQVDCQGCPFALAFSAVQSARPETFDHLLGATKELVAAVRSFMEGIEEALDRPRGNPAAGVEHFEVQ